MNALKMAAIVLIAAGVFGVSLRQFQLYHGLRIFLKNKFDLVFSDYEMPGIDGVAFACSIKKCSPRTPVVIMTGAGRETVLSRNSAAVDEVISKPFTLSELDETIQNLSGRALWV